MVLYPQVETLYIYKMRQTFPSKSTRHDRFLCKALAPCIAHEFFRNLACLFSSVQNRFEHDETRCDADSLFAALSFLNSSLVDYVMQATLRWIY